MFSTGLSPEIYIALVCAFCVPLCVAAYWKKVLSAKGAAAALFVGLFIGILGSILWLLLIFVLLISSFVATKYKFDLKVEKGLQEGKAGERGASNVAVHAIIPCIIAVLEFMESDLGKPVPFFSHTSLGILFIVSIAAAGSDTIASEMGVLSDKTYMITTLRRVKTGTDGGVSAFGTVWAFLGALYISLVGWFIIGIDDPGLLSSLALTLIPLTAGFLGCNIDSVLGATLERRGAIGKHANNLISISCALVFAAGVLAWLKV